jgi:RNA polymerase sigma-70 factor, ECF subfamily
MATMSAKGTLSPANRLLFRRIEPAAGTHERLGHPEVERAPRGAANLPVLATFEELYHDHFDFTFRTLQHLGVPSAALQDGVQEVWLAVHRQLSGFEGRSSHRTWLFSIARNTARNIHRSRRRHEHTGPLGEDLPDHNPGPEQLHAGREALGLVQEYMATLDEERRVLFISQLLEHLSAAESAELLGIDTASVYHRTRDLRRGFKRWLISRQGEDGGGF